MSKPIKDWISDETRKLVDRKRDARLTGDQNQCKAQTKKCKRQVQMDRQEWVDNKAEEGEHALEQGMNEDAFSNFRNLRSTSVHSTTSILDDKGNLVSMKVQKHAVWKDYYSNLLNRPPATPFDELTKAANGVQQDPSIKCEPPSEDEVTKTIGKVKNEGAFGICNITTEMLKAGTVK